jgi:hypothetical protein
MIFILAQGIIEGLDSRSGRFKIFAGIPSARWVRSWVYVRWESEKLLVATRNRNPIFRLYNP